MKQLIILIALVVVGYFAYQHFFIPQQQKDTEEEDSSIDSGSFSINQLPPIPESCEAQAKKLENAIYGVALNEVSYAQSKYADHKFRSCLRNAGFSETQMNGSIAEIEERVKGYRIHDVGR